MTLAESSIVGGRGHERAPRRRSRPPSAGPAGDSLRLLAALVAALALSFGGLLAAGPAGPRAVAAADSTLAPFTPGRHVYDYGKLMSPAAVAIAETLAARIEAAGGGRVVVYTADLMELPDNDTLATAWNVDGLLLTGWEDIGETTLGPTLKARLPTSATEYVKDISSGPAPVQSWVTSTLAQIAALLDGTHVFDGSGVLDATGLARAETAATSLGDRIGATVYIDIAMGDSGDPETTAFFNGADLSGQFARSLVIALAVSDKQIGGYVDSDSDFWDSYETGSPWSYDVLSNETAPNGDVQAELLRAIDAVRKPPDPAEAMSSVATAVHDNVSGFFGDPTNQQDSALGALVALAAIVVFALFRRRRRHEPGYEDDKSVMVSGPPADMTPALAALVASPLDTTRAVTCALLDLAAHGHIAFYQEATPLGPRGGIKVVSASGVGEGTHGAHASAADRPLGPAEQSLLEGLQTAGGGSASVSPTHFAELRPLFEQTGEELERIAGQRGWLRIKTRSVSPAWVAAGLALLVAAGVWAWLRQPIAAGCEAIGGLIVLPRATRMPLPLRTPDGAITAAMVEAYRRTLRRALAGAPGSMPSWLANGEEAALWGYAWGLEGEVQAFVGHNVVVAMHGPSSEAAGPPAYDAASLRTFSVMLDGLAGAGAARPVGLDTDAIANTLSGLGRSINTLASASGIVPVSTAMPAPPQTSGGDEPAG